MRFSGAFSDRRAGGGGQRPVSGIGFLAPRLVRGDDSWTPLTWVVFEECGWPGEMAQRSRRVEPWAGSRGLGAPQSGGARGWRRSSLGPPVWTLDSLLHLL